MAERGPLGERVADGHSQSTSWWMSALFLQEPLKNVLEYGATLLLTKREVRWASDKAIFFSGGFDAVQLEDESQHLLGLGG